MKSTDLFDSLGLKWIPISISVEWNEEKQKNDKVLNPYKETGYRPDVNDFKNDKYKQYKKYKNYEYGAVDTTDFHHIDVDTVKSKDYPDEVLDFIAKNKQERPYYESIGKGNPHFLFKNEKGIKGNRPQTIFKDIELLTGQWAWFKLDCEMYNADLPITPLESKYIVSKPVKKIKKVFKSTNIENNILPNNIPIKQLKPTEEQIEILDNISDEYWTNYDDWMKCIWALHNEFDDIELCNNYSKRASNYESISQVEALCYSDKKKAMSFGTLAYYSKLSNEKKYFQIKAKYSKIQFSDKEFDIAQMYLDVVGDNVVKQDDEVYVYKNPFWKKDKNLDYLRLDITKTMFEVFTNQMINLLKEEIEKDKDNTALKKLITTSIHLIKTGARQKAIATQVKLLLDNEEYDFDLVRPEVICFKNTSFDLLTRKEIQITKYDYITLSTKYDYRKSTEEEFKTINDFIIEILPNKEVRQAALSVLRLALQGKLDQYFILFNGDGGNGKGCILELFEKVLGNEYYYDGHNSILQGKLKSGACPEMANSDKKRCIVYSEPDESEKLNTSTIKQLTGCSVINSRSLYSDNSKVNLTSTSILQCNQRPKLSGRTDNALMRRIVDIHFPMTFVNSSEDLIEGNELVKLKNEKFSLPCFKDTHKFALFDILFQCDKNQIYLPEEVLMRTKQFLFDNDDLLNWFFKYYKLTDDKKKFVKSKDLYDEFRGSDVFSNFTKDERRNEWSVSKFIEKLKTNVALRKYWFDRKKIDGKDLYSLISNYEKIKDDDSDNDEVED